MKFRDNELVNSGLRMEKVVWIANWIAETGRNRMVVTLWDLSG